MIDESFTIDSFVQMTWELIQKVKELFTDNKLFIFSTSWGSIMSTRILEKNCHVVDGVVAWGQIVKDIFFNEEVVNALDKTKLSKTKLEIIKTAQRENVSSRELQLVSSSIRKYTNGYQNRMGEQAPIGPIIKGLLTSPDYSFRDFKAIMVNGYQKNSSLWREILQIDLSGILTKVDIPYVILQGDTDIVASTATVKELVQSSHNSNLQCEIIANSGHMPGKEGMDRVFDKLCLLGQK